MGQAFRIHQIYFQPRQLRYLERTFIPYDNSKCPVPDEREFYVFRTEYERGHISAEGYTGFVSWKFGVKAGLTGDQFLDFCTKNPGYDAYFINPYPADILKGNVWEQGELCHPGLIELTQFIFDQLKYPIPLHEVPRNLRTYASCNFWVGNKRFWDEYMRFCMPVYNYIQNELPEPYRSKLFSPAGKSVTASYFAYIFERLFTTFLNSRPPVSALGYQFSEQELLQREPSRSVNFLNEIYEIEKKSPNISNPIQDTPGLAQALVNFIEEEARQNKFGKFTYKLCRAIWLKIPCRHVILRIGLINTLSRLLLNRLKVPVRPNLQ